MCHTKDGVKKITKTIGVVVIHGVRKDNMYFNEGLFVVMHEVATII